MTDSLETQEHGTEELQDQTKPETIDSNQNKMDSLEVAKIKIAALQRYPYQYNTSVYSTMGFLLLVLGWLVTSIPAQTFLSTYPFISGLGIAMIWVLFIMFGYASLRVHKAFIELQEELLGWEYTSDAIGHIQFTKKGLTTYMAILGVAGIMISAVLGTFIV